MGAEEALFQILKTYGVSSALALAVVISIWRAMSWLAVNVVTPLTNRQMKFFDSIEVSSEQHIKSLDVLVRTVDSQSRNIEQLSHAIDAIRNSMQVQEALMRKLCNEKPGN